MSDHGLHVIAVIMVAVSALALLLTVADRNLMRQAKAGQGHEVEVRADEPAQQPA